MDIPKTLPAFIWHFVKAQWLVFFIVQVLALNWAVDNTFWPYILKSLIDKITAYTEASGPIWTYLFPVLIIWFSVGIVVNISYRVYGFLLAWALPKLQAQIRFKMLNYVQDHSYDYFANHFAGSIANRISDMAQSIFNILQLMFNLFIPAVVAMIIAVVIFFTVQPNFAALLSFWIVLHMGICFISAPRCSSLSNRHSNTRSILNGKIVDSLTNIINVKLFAKKKEELDYINQFLNEERQQHVAAVFFSEKVRIALTISSLLFPFLFMTWYTIHSWHLGVITIGELVLIFNMTWNIQMVTWIAGWELPNLYREIGVAEQALSVIQAKHDVVDVPNAIDRTIDEGRIEFSHVSFHYLAGKKVFQELSLTIPSGQKVGLVGFSGSGKSTFVNLLMRFFDIDSGVIKIDGTDITQFKIESLRRQISMIPQSPTLFHRTLRENIVYGKPDATDEEIFRAAKHAHCDQFINELPEGYDALVGERGVKLSGGQRQRVAIARAILEDAPILILDEATSALDSVTERHIQDALQFLMEGRTTLVIAHRLSTLSEMDRILVFHQGQIVEDGTHNELIEANGHYAYLWRMQASGFLPDSPSNIEGGTE